MHRHLDGAGQPAAPTEAWATDRAKTPPEARALPGDPAERPDNDRPTTIERQSALDSLGSRRSIESMANASSSALVLAGAPEDGSLVAGRLTRLRSQRPNGARQRRGCALQNWANPATHRPALQDAGPHLSRGARLKRTSPPGVDFWISRGAACRHA